MKPLHTQRGSTTLLITIVLMLVLWLAVAASQRGLVFSQRSSTNQYRAAQAFDAAEAGLDWAIAQLNSGTPIDANCRAGADTGPSFIDRYLELPTDDAHLADGPMPRRDPAALQAACVKVAGTWSCSCPTSGTPMLPTPADADGPTVSFVVQFEAGTTPGVVQLVSRGCSGGAPLCAASGSEPPEARTQLQVAIARLPGLDSEPAAALTVRGAMQASTALAVTHQNPASSGITVHAGGEIDAPLLTLTTVPGAPGWASVIDHDPALTALSGPGFFASVFRMDKQLWKAQPMVRQLRCSSACDRALTEAQASHRLLWLDGGLHLDTPITLGTPERPVLLVVDGPVQLNAAAVIHGVVYGTSAEWADHAGTQVHGAVLIEGELRADGVTQVRHDAAALKRLHHRTGTFARVAGSWRDF